MRGGELFNGGPLVAHDSLTFPDSVNICGLVELLSVACVYVGHHVVDSERVPQQLLHQVGQTQPEDRFVRDLHGDQP